VQTRTRNVVCFLTDDFELWELASLLAVFTNVGRKWNWRAFRIHLVAEREDRMRSNSQVEVGPVGTLDAHTSADLLILPGGYGCRRAAQDAAVLQTVKQLATTAERILACSNGSLLLAHAQLLSGARVACSNDIATELKQLDSTIVSSEVPIERHGKILTVATGATAAEAGLRVVADLMGQSIASQTAAALGLPEPMIVRTGAPITRG
jgi:transcriptional regulator GlxA family with amidase domain